MNAVLRGAFRSPSRFVLLVTVLGAGLVAGVFAGGAQESGESRSPVTITFATNRTDIASTTMRDWVDEFEAANPDISVEIEGLANYWSDLQIRLSGRQAPDVFLLNPNNIPFETWSDIAVPYSPDLASRIKVSDDERIDGELYGIPQSANLTGVVYNRNAFETAGIASPPATMDEFYAAADALLAAEITPISFVPRAGWVTGAAVRQIAWQLSLSRGLAVEYRDVMPEVAEPFSAGTPAGDALAMLADMTARGYQGENPSAIDWPTYRLELASGRYAMAYLGTWLIPQVIADGLAADEVGFFPLPIRDEQGQIVANSFPGHRVAVSSDSDYTEAAMRFVDWMFGEGYPFLRDIFGGVSVVDGIEDTNEQLAGYYANDPAITPVTQILTPEYRAITQRVQFGYQDLATAVASGEDLSAVVEDANARWQANR